MNACFFRLCAAVARNFKIIRVVFEEHVISTYVRLRSKSASEFL